MSKPNPLEKFIAGGVSWDKEGYKGGFLSSYHLYNDFHVEPHEIHHFIENTRYVLLGVCDLQNGEETMVYGLKGQTIGDFLLLNDGEEYMVIEAVCEKLSVCKTTVYRWLKDDVNFPKPCKKGKRKVWKKADIEAWISLDNDPNSAIKKALLTSANMTSSNPKKIRCIVVDDDGNYEVFLEDGLLSVFLNETSQKTTVSDMLSFLFETEPEVHEMIVANRSRQANEIVNKVRAFLTSSGRLKQEEKIEAVPTQ